MSLGIAVNGKIFKGKPGVGSGDPTPLNFQSQVLQNYENDFKGSLRRPTKGGTPRDDSPYNLIRNVKRWVLPRLFFMGT